MDVWNERKSDYDVCAAVVEDEEIGPPEENNIM